MKMVRMVFCMMTLITTASSSFAATISRAKAAELACHRLERLVILKKVDKSFIQKFHELELVELNEKDSGGAKFAVTASQVSPHHGSPMSVAIFLDTTGKVLKHQVGEGGQPGSETSWSGKDPLSLVEVGLHYIIDENTKNEQLRPFANDFQSLKIQQSTTNSGPVAIIKMSSSTTTAKLILTLDPNGKLLKKEVVP